MNSFSLRENIRGRTQGLGDHISKSKSRFPWKGSLVKREDNTYFTCDGRREINKSGYTQEICLQHGMSEKTAIPLPRLGGKKNSNFSREKSFWSTSIYVELRFDMNKTGVLLGIGSSLSERAGSSPENFVFLLGNAIRGERLQIRIEVITAKILLEVDTRSNAF